MRKSWTLSKNTDYNSQDTRPILHPAETKSKQRSQCWMTHKAPIPLWFLYSSYFFSSSSTSSSLASEISFLSNSNFKRRLSTSSAQINFTPYCNKKTTAYANTRVPTCAHTHTHMHTHQQTSQHKENMAQSSLIKHTPNVIKKSCGMIAIISLAKYQGTLASKISFLFQACYQY